MNSQTSDNYIVFILEFGSVQVTLGPEKEARGIWHLQRKNTFNLEESDFVFPFVFFTNRFLLLQRGVALSKEFIKRIARMQSLFSSKLKQITDIVIFNPSYNNR